MKYRVDVTIWAETDEDLRQALKEVASSTNLEGRSWERLGVKGTEMRCTITPMPPPNRYAIARSKAAR